MKILQITHHVQFDGNEFEELWMVYTKDVNDQNLPGSLKTGTASSFG